MDSIIDDAFYPFFFPPLRDRQWFPLRDLCFYISSSFLFTLFFQELYSMIQRMYRAQKYRNACASLCSFACDSIANKLTRLVLILLSVIVDICDKFESEKMYGTHIVRNDMAKYTNIQSGILIKTFKKRSGFPINFTPLILFIKILLFVEEAFVSSFFRVYGCICYPIFLPFSLKTKNFTYRSDRREWFLTVTPTNPCNRFLFSFVSQPKQNVTII